MQTFSYSFIIIMYSQYTRPHNTLIVLENTFWRPRSFLVSRVQWPCFHTCLASATKQKACESSIEWLLPRSYWVLFMFQNLDIRIRLSGKGRHCEKEHLLNECEQLLISLSNAQAILWILVHLNTHLQLAQSNTTTRAPQRCSPFILCPHLPLSDHCPCHAMSYQGLIIHTVVIAATGSIRFV